MTILEAAAALRAKKVSSVELTAAALDRVEKLNPKLNAFITVTADLARAQAQAADQNLARGTDRGPLHGIPIALKDLFWTKGIRTTGGSKLFGDFVPERDGAVTEKLRAAGAVLIGKTGLHELAYGITSDNPHYGTIHNPWGMDRIPGGSSGGSASAVAADIVFMAMGTDTGGSIRIPAAFCGISGIKPTYGRVSRYGCMPLSYSLDHMGPLTRTVRDSAVVLGALAGYDSRDDTTSRRPVPDYVPPPDASIRGVRVGVPENFYLDRLAPDVTAAVRRMVQTAAGLGARVETVRVPDIVALNAAGLMIQLAEAAAWMTPYHSQRDKLGVDVRARIDQGFLVPASDYVNAQRFRRVMQNEFRRILESVDCLFAPSTPTGAPRIGQATVVIDGKEEDTRMATTRLVRSINALGLPTVSLPCGFDAEGMPLGLQIVGRPFEEALIVRVGAVLQDATDFLRPPPA